MYNPESRTTYIINHMPEEYAKRCVCDEDKQEQLFKWIADELLEYWIDVESKSESYNEDNEPEYSYWTCDKNSYVDTVQRNLYNSYGSNEYEIRVDNTELYDGSGEFLLCFDASPVYDEHSKINNGLPIGYKIFNVFATSKD